MTLLAPASAEEAQTSWWRPIEWKWPAFSAPPALQVMDWTDAASDDCRINGAAALIVPHADVPPGALFRFLDRLAEDLVPAIILTPPGLGAPPRADDGVIHLSADTDPSIIAAVLASLVERQSAVDSLRSDMRVARRFQSGLRGQIEKVHEELQLAASVQREFLPRALPDMPGIDMHVLFRPCGYVSGDIYDVQKLDEHHLGFFVADAVGHGVPAALMTMVLCRCLTTMEGEGESRQIVPPGRALQRLNQELIQRHGEGSRFATAVYGVIDCRTRRITLAGAGHPYPLRFRGAESTRVETEGGLLGIFAHDEFSETSFTLGDDELLVIYSDGFETAFPASNADEYGRKLPNRNYVDRFADMSDAWRTTGLTPAVRALIEQIDRQAGSLHQADDLTALVIVPSVDRPLDRLFSSAHRSIA